MSVEKSDGISHKNIDHLTPTEFQKIYTDFFREVKSLKNKLNANKINDNTYRTLYTQMAVCAFGLDSQDGEIVSSEKLRVFNYERKRLETASKNYVISSLEFYIDSKDLIKNTFTYPRRRLELISTDHLGLEEELGR